MKLAAHQRKLLAVVAALGLASGTITIAAPAAQAAVTKCQAENLTRKKESTDLQALINAATAGDTLQVKGICVGGFVISKNLTLVGKPTKAVPEPSLDGNNQAQVLVITNRSTITLSSITVTRGFAGVAAGIWMRDSGTLTLNGSTSVTGNRATRLGGGILADSGAAVTLNDTASVTDNIAGGDGGGILSSNGTVTLNDRSVVSGNSAGGVGGGILGVRSSIALNSGSVSENNARTGGGVAIDAGFLAMANASVAGNTAQQNGGGIFVISRNQFISFVCACGSSSVSFNKARWSGGGIHSVGATVTVNGTALVGSNTATERDGGGISSTGTLSLVGAASVTGNTAHQGGGISNTAPFSEANLFESASVAGNTADDIGGGVLNQGTLNLSDNSVVAGNTARDGGGIHSRSLDDGDVASVTMTGQAAVRDNTARVLGGGMYNGSNGAADLRDSSSVTGNSAASGGGIYNHNTAGPSSSATLSLTDESSVSGNSASSSGGGVFNNQGLVTLNDAQRVTQNTPDDCRNC